MKNSDQPAFPFSATTGQNEITNAWGLTKRERFAMAAMQGLLGSPQEVDSEPEYLADLSIRYTDALLKELEETNEDTDQ